MGTSISTNVQKGCVSDFIVLFSNLGGKTLLDIKCGELSSACRNKAYRHVGFFWYCHISFVMLVLSAIVVPALYLVPKLWIGFVMDSKRNSGIKSSPGFWPVSQRHVQNPVKLLWCSFLLKAVDYFRINLHLRYWSG